MTTIPEPFLKEISDLIQSKRLVILCGSGVSASPPSNLPLAKELREYILDRVLGSETCQRFAAKFKKVPLEGVIDVIERNSPQFLQALSLLFTSAEPNADHYFLAGLMAKGYLQTIMTTNFDTLLEKALSRQDHVSFKVFSREEEFGDLKLTELLQTSVIKIHGTADDLTSIRSTLRLVAMPLRSEARKKVLSLFFEVLQKDVLILGYGATDEFDINPVLRSLKTTGRIYQIHHSEDIFEMQSLDDPFAGLEGVKVSCNTQQLLGALRKRILGEINPNSNGISAWRSAIDDWATKLDVGVRQFIASDLMELIGQLAEAREYLEDCLTRWSQDDDKRMRALLNLGSLEENMSMFPEAEAHFRECFSIAAKLGNDMAKAMSLQHLGQLAYQRRDFPSAMILTRQGQDLFQKTRGEVSSGVSVSLHQIGMIYMDMGLPVKAEWRLRESLKMSRDLGDIEGEAKSLAQLGLLYKSQNESPEAVSSFRDARSLFSKLGREDMVTRIDLALKQIEERRSSSSALTEQVTELNAQHLPIEKHYCRVSTRKLDSPPRMQHIFKVGIRLRNKSSEKLHVEYVEAISDSITFSNGQTFANRKPNRKEAFGQPLPPNGLLECEWDETHETDHTAAKPAFVRYRVLVGLKEKSDPIEYVLNISSPEFRF